MRVFLQRDEREAKMRVLIPIFPRELAGLSGDLRFSWQDGLQGKKEAQRRRATSTGGYVLGGLETVWNFRL